MATTKDADTKEIMFYCDGCFRDITRLNFITCDNCEFDCCVKCYKENVETDTHKHTHSYRIVGALEDQLDDKWTILEQILLLNGLIYNGIDNFKEIANTIPTKTQEELKNRFHEITGIKNNTEGELVVQPHDYRSDPNDPCIINYMPERNEFEIELFNDYENLLEHTQMEPHDTSITKELKNHIFYFTRCILKQRRIWRNFVLDRKLYKISDFKRIDETPYGAYASKYKWMSQILSRDDFNRVTSGFYHESILKERVKSLITNEIVPVDKLTEFGDVLGQNEKNLCLKLKLSELNYVKLKRLALELFVNNLPLKSRFFDLFPEKDQNRAEIIYQWFNSNGIVIE